MYVKELSDRLGETVNVHNMHLSSPEIDIGDIIRSWSESKEKREGGDHQFKPCLYHLDMTLADENGRSDLLFSLAISSCLVDEQGDVWVCGKEDIYIPEMTAASGGDPDSSYPAFYQLLPMITCLNPKESLDLLTKENFVGKQIIPCSQSEGNLIHLMSLKLFQNPVVQRPYQYLSLYKTKSKELERFSYQNSQEKDPSYMMDCLSVLLK